MNSALRDRKWWTTLRRRTQDEEGVALVTALLVTMVLASISVTVVGLSVHNSTASGYDRNRLLAVDSAEAGLDAVLSTMAHTGTTSLPCGPGAVTEVLPTTPPAQYRVKVTYYATFPPSGTAMDCPLTDAARPAGAVVVSRGTAAPGSHQPVKRTMQTQIRLTPIYGAFGQAIFSNSGLQLDNNLTVTGDQGNDGNLYTNGTWNCTNNSIINGSVYAQGGASMTNGCSVAQDVWAGGAISMSNSGHIGHDVTSSTSSVTMSNSATVIHNATAGTACTGCDGRVGGAITPTHVSPAPPYLAFPTVDYDAFAWQAGGFDVSHTFSSCSSAMSFAMDVGSATKTVVRITPACALALATGSTVQLREDLAIVTDGSISTVNKTVFQSADGQPHNLYLIVPSTAVGGGCANGTHDISIANNTDFNNVRLFIYSPCNVSFNNNNNGLGGQIFGGTVSITNLYSLQFSPMLIPGSGLVTGYNSDIAFLREIANEAE